MSILNDRIREVRISRGLTLKDVAVALGVEEATAQRYESGSIKNIKHESVCQIAELFNCDPSYLMGWSDSPYKVGGEIETCAISNLEYELIKKYRLLDPRGQQAVVDTLERELGYTGQSARVMLAARSGEVGNSVVHIDAAKKALDFIDRNENEADGENDGL